MKHWEAHPEYVEGCFGCKGLTLVLSAGDANSNKTMPSKQWDSELAAYKRAREQGIQPAGTSMKKVQEALKASDTLGKPYNAEKMPKAKDINKKTAEVMKEVGL